MDFRESYEKKGDFSHTDANGKQVTRKFTLRYTFTDKMKAPEVVIKGDPEEKTVRAFISEIKARFHRTFEYYPALKRVEYREERKSLPAHS